jgi:hypothetical protein
LAVQDGDPSLTLLDGDERERAAICVIGDSTRLDLVSRNSLLCFLSDKGDRHMIQLLGSNGEPIWSAP